MDPELRRQFIATMVDRGYDLQLAGTIANNVARYPESQRAYARELDMARRQVEQQRAAAAAQQQWNAGAFIPAENSARARANAASLARDDYFEPPDQRVVDRGPTAADQQMAAQYAKKARAQQVIVGFGVDRINKMVTQLGVIPQVAAQIVGSLYSPHFQAIERVGNERTPPPNFSSGSDSVGGAVGDAGSSVISAVRDAAGL